MHLPLDTFCKFEDIDTELGNKIQTVIDAADYASKHYLSKQLSEVVADGEGCVFAFFYRNKDGDIEIMSEFNNVYKTDPKITQSFDVTDAEGVQAYVLSCEKLPLPLSTNRFGVSSDTPVTDINEIIAGVKTLKIAGPNGEGSIKAYRVV